MKRNCGFTIMELLATCSVIIIIAALLLPALSKAKARASGAKCLNNSGQLIRAMHLYAGEHDDWLPPNPENGHTNAWIRGSMRNPREATNTVYLTDPRFAKLSPYVRGEHSIYKCPSDRTKVQISGRRFLRVRTISMSQAIGTEADAPRRAVAGKWLDGTRAHVRNRPFRTYGTLADMIDPTPADLWVLLDEEARLLNDGAFAVTMVDPPAYIDWPGTYHNNAAGFAFADGHSEIRRWVDGRSRIPIALLEGNPDAYNQSKVQPGNRDIFWLRERTSAAVGR